MKDTIDWKMNQRSQSSLTYRGISSLTALRVIVTNNGLGWGFTLWRAVGSELEGWTLFECVGGAVNEDWTSEHAMEAAAVATEAFNSTPSGEVE